MEQLGENQDSPPAGQADGQAQTQPGAPSANPVPDLAQVAVDAVAETEGITPHQARTKFKEHLQYVETRTRERLREHVSQQGTAEGFDCTTIATIYAKGAKAAAENLEKYKHSGRIDFEPVGIECSSMLARLYLANKWSNKITEELTKTLDIMTLNLRFSDEQMNEVSQAWQLVKELLGTINNQADLIEMAFDRLDTNMDNLIDEIRKEI